MRGGESMMSIVLVVLASADCRLGMGTSVRVGFYSRHVELKLGRGFLICRSRVNGFVPSSSLNGGCRLQEGPGCVHSTSQALAATH